MVALIEQEFELKLASGKVVTWTGETGEDAAYRYTDCFQGTTVVAGRPIRHGIFLYNPGMRIIE